MELAGDEPGMIGDFDHFDEFAVFGAARHPHAPLLESLHVVVVYFVTMAVPFVDHLLPVGLPGQGILREHTGLFAKAHGAAEVFVAGALFDLAFPVGPFGDQADHRVRRGDVDFS